MGSQHEACLLSLHFPILGIRNFLICHQAMGSSLDFALVQWFSTGVHIDPRGPCNISGYPQAKHNKLGVHNDILGVHEENQLRTFFIFKNSISNVIYIILKTIY